MANNFSIWECPCCQEEFLVNFVDGSFEHLAADTGDEDEELELRHGDDSHRHETDPNLYQEAYEVGKPVVTGVRKGDVVVNTPHTNRHSGIRTETQVGPPKPQNVRKPRRATGGMQAPGSVSPSRPPKKKRLTDADLARDGFEASGDDIGQDFTGLTGADQHFDNLLQEAYENDLADRGF
jgi:hypothetical protein